MTEKLSNKYQNKEGRRTRKDQTYGSCVDAEEKQNTSGQNIDSIITSKYENGSLNNMYSEPEIKPPDGGWGWVIVLASFFMHLISGYQKIMICVRI